MITRLAWLFHLAGEVAELRGNAVSGASADRGIWKIPEGSVPPGFKAGRTRAVAMFMIGWVTIQIRHAFKNLVNGRINGVLAGRREKLEDDTASGSDQVSRAAVANRLLESFTPRPSEASAARLLVILRCLTSHRLFAGSLLSASSNTNIS
jgi:hypothetical protein